jgi:hypothetical protein
MTDRHAELDFIHTEDSRKEITDNKVDHKAILAAIKKRNIPVEEVVVSLPLNFGSTAEFD